MTAQYNPHYEGPAARPPKIQYSRLEVQHLGLAFVTLSLAFAFVLEHDTRYLPDGSTLLSAAVAVATGFLLHELAHKLVAQHFGHWAEFRASPGGLGIALVLAIMLRVLIAAPGAVMIMGRVTLRENGLISAVGPGTNLFMGGLTLPWVLTSVLDAETLGYEVLQTVAVVNGLLCAFNLLPFGPLDGKKVMRWNPVLWGLMLAGGITIFVLAYFFGA